MTTLSHAQNAPSPEDLMAGGVGILPIMQAGGWKSMNVLGRYVQHAEIGLHAKSRNY
jgi:hypothetical protein